MITLLLLTLAVDPASTVLRIPLAPRETLTVTIAAPARTDAPVATRPLPEPGALFVLDAPAAIPAAPRIPIVLLPGLMGGAFGYRAVAPALAAAGHPTYTIELLGTGSSSHPEDGDYTLDAQADRVATVLDLLGVGSAIIAGSNFGASVALRVAYRRPEHAAAVLLLDGGPVDRSYTEGVSSAMKLWPIIKLFGGRGIAKRRIRDALRSSSADPAWVTDSVVDEYARPIVHDLGATMAVMEAMRRAPVEAPLRDNLERITQPVLLMVGAANRSHGIRPEQTALLHERLRNLVVDSVARSGVYLYEERPDAVIAELLALGRSLAALGPMAANSTSALSKHSTVEAP